MKGRDIKLNILVAEDDELNRMLLCEILEKYGCTYKAADNGRAAVDLFLKESFDLILLDLHMPVMGGMETARALKELESEGIGHTPVAILSASALMSESERSFAGEMDYHLMKPYHPKEIYLLLDNLKDTLAGISCDNILRDQTRNAQQAVSGNQAAGQTARFDENVKADHLSREEMFKVFEKMDCDIPFFETLLEKFKDSSAELLERIRQAIQENNCDAMFEYTHALKGEFHIFNAAVPVRIAEALERVTKTGCVPDSAQDVVAKLEEEVRDIIESYTDFINKER